MKHYDPAAVMSAAQVHVDRIAGLVAQLPAAERLAEFTRIEGEFDIMFRRCCPDLPEILCRERARRLAEQVRQRVHELGRGADVPRRDPVAMGGSDGY